jgi:DNA-binding LacI/PurR family transcriptional regulator
MRTSDRWVAGHRRTLSWAAMVSALLAGSLVLTACGSAGTAGSAGNSNSSNATVGVSLILKTLTNPYFVSMENDAKQEATKDGVNLTVSAGTQDGDTQTQISAIDNAISRGDKGIIITPNGNAVNTELAKARQAGLYLIALDTVHTRPSAGAESVRAGLSVVVSAVRVCSQQVLGMGAGQGETTTAPRHHEIREYHALCSRAPWRSRCWTETNTPRCGGLSGRSPLLIPSSLLCCAMGSAASRRPVAGPGGPC